MTPDTVLRRARLAGAGADAPPVDIGIAGGRIAAIEPEIPSEAGAPRPRRPLRLGRPRRDPHPPRQVAHHRPVRAGRRTRPRPHAARGRGQARVHGGGRPCAGRGDPGAMHPQRHDARAHPRGGRSQRRPARLRGPAAVGRRLRMGRRSGAVRLRPGRLDQRAGGRSERSGGTGAGRRGGRGRPPGTIRTTPGRSGASSSLPASTIATWISISTSAPARTRWTSIWSAS